MAAGLVRRGHSLRPALVSTAGFAAFAAAWWVAVVRVASTSGLRAYWADRYGDLAAGPGEAAADVATGLAEVARGFAALPGPATLVVLATAAAVVVWRRPRLAVLVLAPTVVAVVLAALRLAPLGGGRTDIHLYSSLALLVALALHLGATRPPPSATAVYSASRWAYALYSSGPVELVRDPTSANGFDVALADERVEVLGPHRDDPSRQLPTIDRLAADHDRIWLVSSHVNADLAVVEERLAERGFTATDTRPGAMLTLWSRTG